jgi:hypothetical protein
MATSTTPESCPTMNVEIDGAKLIRVLARLRAKQSFMFGTMAGLLAGLISTFLWAVLVGMTGLQYELEWLPMVGVGFIVGLTVRIFGRGLDPSFGIAAAMIAIACSLLGNFFSMGLGLTGQLWGANVGQVLYHHESWEITWRLYQSSFGMVELGLMLFTAWEAYALARWRFSETQMATLAPRGTFAIC